MAMIKLTGLWQTQGKNGENYLRGNISKGAGFMVLKNQFRRSEKDPAHNLFIVENEKSKDAGAKDDQPAPDDF
jgi:hypothetical protein